MRRSAIERLAIRSILRPSGCREWAGAVGTHGYGVIGYQSQVVLAHRLAWELSRGLIPAGMFVCHRCDNRRCINVEHLFLGTQSDNMRDAASKGRIVCNLPHRRGAAAPGAKLTAAQVEWLREVVEAGVMTQDAAARVLGISSGHTSRIVNRSRWSGGEAA